MTPNIDELNEQIEEVTYPTRTYAINLDDAKREDVDKANRVKGYTDDIEAVKQQIYLILNTERYAHIIYSWDYGVELADLIGKPVPYCISEIPRRITEALTQDDRIDDVVDFEFERNKGKIHTTFKVVTNVGNIESELEVTI